MMVNGTSVSPLMNGRPSSSRVSTESGPSHSVKSGAQTRPSTRNAVEALGVGWTSSMT